MLMFGKTSNIFSNTLVENFMIVGTEWLIEAGGCNAETLRDLRVLQTVFARIISDLGLKTVGEINWHKFAGEGGVTGLAMLTESHLACHTYPEHSTATFNLYCCRSRPKWNWEENLTEILEAKNVSVTKIERGNPQSEIRNPKSKSVGGEI